MVVGILFYRWKTILVVGSKSGRNLIIGSSHSRWGSILTVGSHLTSIWTIRCTWNWSLELGPNLDLQINVGKLGAVGSAVGARCRFFQKITNISLFTEISPIFGEIYGYFFCRHFTPLFRFLDPWNTKFHQNFGKKTEIFILVHNLISFCNYSHPCANEYS